MSARMMKITPQTTFFQLIRVLVLSSVHSFVHRLEKQMNLLWLLGLCFYVCLAPMSSFPTLKRYVRTSTCRFLSSAHSRQSSAGLSLDANLVGTKNEVLVSHLKSRRASKELIETVAKIPTLRAERNALIVEGDAARNARKNLSKEIGILMKNGKISEVESLKLKVEEYNQVSSVAAEKQVIIDQQIEDILSQVPNLLDDKVPDGSDDSDNLVISTWGDEKRMIGDGYLWHDDIARGLGGLDNEAATRISGTRFSVLIGDVARLERALINYFVDYHLKKGYMEVSVPYIVTRSTLYGTGQLPKFEDDLFKVNHNVAGEDAFLIPTAEVSVTNLFRDQILNATQLPLKLVCHSPSFRAEAGSSGKDTRGLLRQHQFHKVELVKICEPNSSEKEHESLTQDAEDLLKSLELPYRKLLLCSGDTGFSARICYDLEVWLPGQQAYREISSCSNCFDFQSRRMKLRYKDMHEKEKKTIHPHTINGSGVAVGRALVAILENNQRPDGSVKIPECLRPYMGGLSELKPKKQDCIYHKV